MPSTDSIIVPVYADDARLVSLGLYQLSGDLQDARALPSHETLLTRFDAAEGVLADRNWTTTAEKALIEGREASTSYRKAKSGDFVQVRLTLDQLKLTVQALQDFRDRAEPATDRFAEDSTTLIDSHSKVERVITRYKQALILCETASTLGEREANLLR